MKLLLIEHDDEIAAGIVCGFAERSIAVEHASTGRGGFFLAGTETYDVLIVDGMMPGMDGLSIVTALRTADVCTPTIMISGLSETADRVAGLQSGADDYLGKPFAMSELIARVGALARRQALSDTEIVLRAGGLELDLLKREARMGMKTVDLQRREFAVLEFLVRRKGQIVTRNMLYEGVWKRELGQNSGAVDSFVSRVRSKLGEAPGLRMIETIRGHGYRFNVWPPKQRLTDPP
jgi:two-component system, OmpR family, response regulator